MRGSAEDKNHNPILHFTSVLIFSIKACFLCHVLAYKWCWITNYAFYRQQAFGEHSLLPVTFLFLLLWPLHYWTNLSTCVINLAGILSLELMCV